MKKLKLVFATLLFAGLFFTACKKTAETSVLEEPLSIEEATSISEEIVEAEATFEEAEFTANEELDVILNGPPPPGDCPTITKDQAQGVFPVTVTIDFGDNCVSPNGKTRSGKIIITLSAKPMTPGATKIMTFEDFVVDEKAIEGVRTWTNNGKDAQGRPSWTRTTTGAKITWPNGDMKSWGADHTVLQTAGFTTPLLKIDNEFEITGSRSVVRKDGSTFASVITAPLLKKHICPWIVSGVREVTRNGNTVTLDYGNGDCDKFGTVTMPDGSTKQIKLKKWRHH